jgi:hypothetical protein
MQFIITFKSVIMPSLDLDLDSSNDRGQLLGTLSLFFDIHLVELSDDKEAGTGHLFLVPTFHVHFPPREHNRFIKARDIVLPVK